MYQITPTILDKFNTFDTFRTDESFNELIDKLNGVKTEMTNRVIEGIALNSLIDYNLKTETVEYEFDGYRFKHEVINELTGTLKGSEVQKFVECFVNINGVDVRLYGVTDYVKSSNVIDLKSTEKYKLNKYKYYSQRHIYPLCFPSNTIRKFTYLVTDFQSVMKEDYFFSRRESLAYLNERIPLLIEFIESNRDLIYKQTPSFIASPIPEGIMIEKI